MSLAALSEQKRPSGFAFLDPSAKREIRRKILKAIAIPGCQIPYASREMPMARGWGTGGLQVSLTLAKHRARVKVIDQGADDSVNAASIRRFLARTAGMIGTDDALLADLIQSRHRIPEERLGPRQVLVLQVPDPEALRPVQPNMSIAREMHSDADYSRLWLILYEQIVRAGRVMLADSYPGLVNGRHVMNPSPIPRWDLPKLHQSRHLTLLSAGREKRIYAVPPFTNVEPLAFDDVPFKVEDMDGRVCMRSGASGFFMNEIPRPDGGSDFEISDSDYGVKTIRRNEGEQVEIGETWYQEGRLRS